MLKRRHWWQHWIRIIVYYVKNFFFFLKRVEIGPTVITTGNCSELGDLISMVWPSLLLLCTLHMFHMLFGVRCLFEPNHKHCIKPIAQKSFYSCRSWFMGKVLTDLKLTLKGMMQKELKECYKNMQILFITRINVLQLIKPGDSIFDPSCQ